MGTRGPAPKRSEARTRRNKTQEDGLTLKKGEALPFKWPRASGDWDAPVKRFYKSLQESGQAAYFQASDANLAWLACDELNDYRQSGNKSAMKLQSVMGMLSSGLLLTEGERRRASVELELPGPEVEDELAKKRRETMSELRQKAQ